MKTDKPWLARVDRHPDLHSWLPDRYVTHEKGSCRLGGNFAIKGLIKELHKPKKPNQNKTSMKLFPLKQDSQLVCCKTVCTCMGRRCVCFNTQGTRQREVVKMWFLQDEKWTQAFVCLCMHRWSWGPSLAVEYLLEAKQQGAASCTSKHLSVQQSQRSPLRQVITTILPTAQHLQSCIHCLLPLPETRGHCMVCTSYMMYYRQWHWQALVLVPCPG